ncbi:MAG: hypothetical protein H6622_15295 [Halobacteriovoraceae bacterium]|nr:hypothetical protein [Halobacteriovoraceae bacterium]
MIILWKRRKLSKGYSVAEVSVALAVVAAVAIAAIKIVGEKYTGKTGRADKIITTTVRYMRDQLQHPQSCKITFGGVKIKGSTKSFEAIMTQNGVAQFRAGNKISNNHRLEYIQLRYIDTLLDGREAYMLKILFKYTKKVNSDLDFVYRTIVYAQTDNQGKVSACNLGQAMAI